ncbi:hypothetical protein AAFP32_12125 [Brevibacterium sp. CBA3109]|uniref:Uncharacterized protein n=1 Tax=Brevibacterium koreense TaxID=3140787 RepID=A0AAU7UIP7_9MICO
MTAEWSPDDIRRFQKMARDISTSYSAETIAEMRKIASKMVAPSAAELARSAKAFTASTELQETAARAVRLAIDQLPRIRVHVPDVPALDDLSKHYAQLIKDNTSLGMRFDLSAIRNIMAGIQSGPLDEDSDFPLDDKSEALIEHFVDDELAHLPQSSLSSLTESQRRNLRRTLRTLIFILLTTTTYIGTGSLDSDLAEFYKWVAAVLEAWGVYSFKDWADKVVDWADDDDHEEPGDTSSD